MITFYLTVNTENHFGGGTLFFHKMDTPHTPREGDLVDIFDGVTTYVKRPHWTVADDDGFGVDLVPFVVDPDEEMERHLPSHNLRPWRTEQEGSDLIERLLASGWSRYTTKEDD